MIPTAESHWLNLSFLTDSPWEPVKLFIEYVVDADSYSPCELWEKVLEVWKDELPRSAWNCPFTDWGSYVQGYSSPDDPCWIKADEEMFQCYPYLRIRETYNQLATLPYYHLQEIALPSPTWDGEKVKWTVSFTVPSIGKNITLISYALVFSRGGEEAVYSFLPTFQNVAGGDTLQREVFFAL